MYCNKGFYDVHCKGMRSQPHIKVQVFAPFLIFNRSEDGLIDKPKLVTCKKFANFFAHDGVWNT